MATIRTNELGKVYSWVDISVQLTNDIQPLAGITSISFDDPEEFELVYGAGNRAVGYGSGNVAPEVSMTILYDEVQRLLTRIPTRRLQDEPLFNIIVSYSPKDNPSKKHVVSLLGCKFKNTPTTLSQNDKAFSVDLELMCLDIKRI